MPEKAQEKAQEKTFDVSQDLDKDHFIHMKFGPWELISKGGLYCHTILYNGISLPATRVVLSIDCSDIGYPKLEVELEDIMQTKERQVGELVRTTETKDEFTKFPRGREFI